MVVVANPIKQSSFTLKCSPFSQRVGIHRSGAVKTNALFGFGGKDKREKSERDLEREEQWQAQQEILARRKNNSWQKGVSERRAKVKKYMNDPEFKKKCDEENRQKFLAKKAEEGPEPKFGIIIPIIPVGIPEYDGGERFDLRLPYVDNGWVDEEADIGRQFRRFLGLEKKKKNDDKDGKKR